MCSEVKTIKEKYSYNFEKFLKINNEACPQRIDIIKELETLAENLVSNILKNDNSIERIKNNEVAIPIIGICKHFGFKIYDMDFEFLSEKNKEYKNASGMIAISQKFKSLFNTDKVLFLNKTESFEHSRFTIAHEIAHYLFDFNEKKEFEYLNFYRTEENYINNIEKRASRFAAALLMPKNIFKHEYDSLPNDITYYELITKLSEIFMAPTTAVDIRVKELKELGVI